MQRASEIERMKFDVYIVEAAEAKGGGKSMRVVLRTGEEWLNVGGGRRADGRRS